MTEPLEIFDLRLRADLAVVPSSCTAATLLALDVKQLEGLGVPFMQTIWNEQQTLRIRVSPSVRSLDMESDM